MAGIDPGEFGRGAAAREEARIDRERVVLDELLAAGWNRATAAEARRLQVAIGDAVAKWMSRTAPTPYDETALSLVGEARGVAVADWWAQLQDVDDRTRRLLRECAASAAAMALIDGFALGRESAREEQAGSIVPAPTASSNGRAPGAAVALSAGR